MKTLQESQIFQTSTLTFHIKSNESFTSPPRELVYILEETGPERLRVESLRTFGGSPGVILSSEFRIDQLPDESFLLTFSMELKKSSNLNSSNGFHHLNSGEALGSLLTKLLQEHFILKMVLSLNSCRTTKIWTSSRERHGILSILTRSLPKQYIQKIWLDSSTEKAIAG